MNKQVISKRTHMGLLTLIFTLTLVGCGGDNNATPASGSGGKRLRVVATTTQLQDFAKHILGDKVELVGILTADADPHEYEPTADDAKKLADADLILRSGVELEKWLDKLITASGTKATIVDTGKGITLRKGDDAEPAGDPHIWFNPDNAKLMSDNIAAAAAANDAANAAAYKDAAVNYKAQIDELDQYIQSAWATKLPNPADRKLVTNHDAFGYYVEKYKLNFIGSVIPSLDTNYNPSAQELAALEGKIKSEGVKAIFLESSINPKLAQQIAGDTGVQIIDSLYADTLGPVGSAGDSYLGMMRYDTDAMIAGMTGQPLPTPSK